MAKAASDDCQRLSCCRDSFQSFGGIGFTWEHDSHLFIKRAETTGTLFGGSAAHSVAVAAALGMPRPDPAEGRLAACAPVMTHRRAGLAPASRGRLVPPHLGGAGRGRRAARPAAPSTTCSSRARSSAWHRIDATELWHFYAGDPLELRREWPDGTAGACRSSGPTSAPGQSPQAVVEAGVWQSARPLGRYTLVGATVTPAFTFEGFELREGVRAPGRHDRPFWLGRSADAAARARRRAT